MRRGTFALALLLVGCGSSHRNTASEDTGVDDGATDGTTEAEVGDPTCPPGPYGLRVGDTVPCLTFKGYKDSIGEYTDIAIKDYWDPTGKKGNTVLVLVANAVWCIPCKNLITWMSDFYANPDVLIKGQPPYRNLGAKFVSVLIEANPPGTPSDKAALDLWVKVCKLTFDSMLGPEREVTKVDDFSFPYTFIVDTTTMRIQQTIVGFPGPYQHLAAIDAILARHGKDAGPPLDAVSDTAPEAADAADAADVVDSADGD